LRSPVSLDYEVFGFVLGQLHVRNVPVKLACILPYELIAFPDLDGRQLGDCLALARLPTCAWGSGRKKTFLIDSILRKLEVAETQLRSRDLVPNGLCRR
jgi:hypothetical protein